MYPSVPKKTIVSKKTVVLGMNLDNGTVGFNSTDANFLFDFGDDLLCPVGGFL